MSIQLGQVFRACVIVFSIGYRLGALDGMLPVPE